jgi:hypothetical protein
MICRNEPLKQVAQLLRREIHGRKVISCTVDAVEGVS